MRRLEAGEKLCLLDVREADEVAANPLPIEGTKVITFGELRDHWEEIPKDCPIITVCGLGIRLRSSLHNARIRTWPSDFSPGRTLGCKFLL